MWLFPCGASPATQRMGVEEGEAIHWSAGIMGEAAVDVIPALIGLLGTVLGAVIALAVSGQRRRLETAWALHRELN